MAPSGVCVAGLYVRVMPSSTAGGSHSVPGGSSSRSCCEGVASVLPGTPTPRPTSIENSLRWSTTSCGKSAHTSAPRVKPRSCTLPATTSGCPCIMMSTVVEAAGCPEIHGAASYRESRLRFCRKVTHVASKAHASVFCSWKASCSSAAPSSSTGVADELQTTCMDRPLATSAACTRLGAQSTPARSTPDCHSAAPRITSAKGPPPRMRSAMQYGKQLTRVNALVHARKAGPPSAPHTGIT